MTNNIQDMLSKLSAEEVEALILQASKTQTKASQAQKRKATYSKSLTDFVTQVIEGEEYNAPAGKAWAGYDVRGIPVVIEGHTFTLSVKVTDTQATDERTSALKIAEARALLATADAGE